MTMARACMLLQVWFVLSPYHDVDLRWYAKMLRLHVAWHMAPGGLGVHKYLVYVTQVH
jgi:hypothetical protein